MGGKGGKKDFRSHEGFFFFNPSDRVVEMLFK